MTKINLDEYDLIKPDHVFIEEKRLEKNFTQKQVADYAHITERQYRRYENGEKSIASASMRIGLAICSMLDIDPYLFQVRYKETE